MSTPVFLVVPQWQGSPSSRAMRIAEGAQALAEDLPSQAKRLVEVPLEAGDALGTPVARLSSILQAQQATRQALHALDSASEVPVVLGGDCSTALPVLDHLTRDDTPESLAVLWCDAHVDLQDPSTSPSGAAAGMTLRHALGDGEADLRLSVPVAGAQVLLLGARDISQEEEQTISAHGLTLLPLVSEADALAEQVTAALIASGATRVYVHVDLDVFDPAEFSAADAALPFGVSLADLTAAIRAAVTTLPLAGATISGFAPASPVAAADDQPTVLRLLGAVTSGLRA